MLPQVDVPLFARELAASPAGRGSPKWLAVTRGSAPILEGRQVLSWAAAFRLHGGYM